MTEKTLEALAANQEIRTIVVNEAIADIIMGALAVTYSEGIDGIVHPNNDVDYIEEEQRLVRVINVVYPHIVAKYNWLPAVESVVKNGSL